MIININNPPLHAVEISRQGENEFREIEIDVSAWLAEYPDGKISVIYCRPDGELYPVIVNATESPIVWRPTATDTAVAGKGAIEVRITYGSVLGKSCTIAAKVLGALGVPGDTPAAPAPDWAQKVAEDAASAAAAAEKAEAASTHMPQISASKTWLVWDADAGEYVDSGVSAAGAKGDDGDPGKAPIIGSNGNWYEWDDASGAYTDTGKPSRGEKGETGASVTIDDTLTQSGQAADAKATGDAISALSEEIANIPSGVTGSGITETARALLISILRNAVYSSDQSASITALNTELAENSSGQGGGSGGDETTSYTVVNNLTNLENSNSSTSVYSGSTYVATLTGTGDYSIDTVTITMGGVDITATAWDAATGSITIAKVTGDIIITATGKIVQAETLEIVYSSNYPNVTTFEYKESKEAGIYVIAKQGEIQGGLLNVDYDTEIYNNWNLNLYVFDSDGNPYCQTDQIYSGNNTAYNWGENECPGWEDVGAGHGFGCVKAPFSVQIPDGCTFIACMRRGNSSTGTGMEGTISNANFVTWAKSGGITLTVTG